MSKEKLLKELNNLAQLDIDAVHAYNQALNHITDEEIHHNISQFRDDHLRHIDDLSKVIVNYGEKAPEMTQDFKGYLIEGFTSLRSITGTEGALKAMETNEVLTNRKYHDALNIENLPSDIKDLLERNYADEKKHLEYIRSTIENMD